MSWACVHLPSLALDAALRRREAMTGPFALIHGSGQQRRVLAANATARRAGVEAGLRLSEAEAVCPVLITAEHDPAHMAADRQLVAAWAYRYSAQVVLDPPGAVALEIGRSLSLFGPWEALQARWRRELADLGFAHAIARAPNPHAAHVLAAHHDGTVVTATEGLSAALADIPVLATGLPQADALPDMGIRTLSQLLALPPASLRRRFGKRLVEALERLIGQRPHTLSAYTPPDTFTTETELPAAVTSHDTLLFPLRRMVSDLATFAAARDGGITAFTVRFGHEDATPSDMRVGLLTPERRADTLFELARLQLDRTTLAQPVTTLGVHADSLPPLVPAGRDLFDTRPAEALPWTQLRERLRARLGADAVHGLAHDPDPRPEHASPAAVADAPAHYAATAAPVRPTWLLARPVLLRETAPRVLAGPERIETGWWDGGDIRRDYYVLELANGQRAWAFRPPGEGGPFMLHGWFA